MKRALHPLQAIVLIGLGSAWVACVSPPVARVVPDTAPPLPPTQVFFYPLHNQSAEQQDRDRYECYLWARQQTGFDPSAPQLAPHQRLEVIPEPPPGQGTAVGAVTGAIIGSMVTGPHEAAGGALAGAVAGAMVGAASDTARQEEAARLQSHYDRQSAEQYARLEQRASDYRRAVTACLEGRGYSVR